MIVAIHQPQYIPWLGYFYKMDKADMFIHLDTVQFRRNEFQNRNRIKAMNGWNWLTVPVEYTDHKQLIKDVMVNNSIRWQNKHKKSIMDSYENSENYQDIITVIEWIFTSHWQSLSTLNIDIVNCFKELMGITTEEVCASDLSVDTKQPDNRIIELIKEVGGDTYLSGPGGKNYMDLEAYKAAGIKVVFSTFNHPVYKQLFGEFQPHMSILDLLFNYGGDSLNVIRGLKNV